MDGWIGGGEGDLGRFSEGSVTRSERRRGDSVDARLVDSSYIALLPTHGLRHNRRGMSSGEGE